MNTQFLSLAGTAPHMAKWRWSIWCVCILLWTLALLTPHPVEISRQLLPTQVQFPVSKLLHVSGYAFLAVLSAWLQVRGSRRWLLVLFLSLHGLLTEYFQNFVPPRTGSWRDVGLDHLGLLLGLALSWKCWLPQPARPQDGEP